MSEALRQEVFIVVDLLVKNAEDEAGSNINKINLLSASNFHDGVAS